MFGTSDGLRRIQLTALDSVNRIFSDLSGGLILMIWAM